MAPERTSSTSWTVYRLQRQTAQALCHERLSSCCGDCGRRCFPTSQGLQGTVRLSCHPQDDVGTTPQLRRVTYAWVQDHLIG